MCKTHKLFFFQKAFFVQNADFCKKLVNFFKKKG